MNMLNPDTLLQNRYRIVQQIGQGGMGAVYEAVDERLGNRVALKQQLLTGESLERAFTREARILAGLNHPALPNVIDHWTEPAGQFLVMQYIPGDDLAQLLANRGTPFPVEQVLQWGDQLLDALDYLHTLEPPVIHRDIKPHNLKLQGRGGIVLLDFGLAKGHTADMTQITSASVMGHTPGFAPPEQMEGTGTDARSDLFALGATLQQLLTNAAMPDALTRLRAVARRQADPVPLAHELNSEVPAPVSAVLRQAMALDPDERLPSAAAMRAALQAAGSGLSAPPADLKASTKDASPVPVAPPTMIEGLPATQPRRRRNGWLLPLLVGLVALVVLVILLVPNLLNSFTTAQNPSSQTGSAITAGPTIAPSTSANGDPSVVPDTVNTSEPVTPPPTAGGNDAPGNGSDTAAAATFLNQGLDNYKQGLFDQAIADYTEAIRLNPSYEAAYNNRGLVYFDKAAYDQALRDYNRAIELKPSYPDPHNNRGRVYFVQGNYDQAIADYSQAIQLYPAYDTAYLNRGLAFQERSGPTDREAAIADYRKFLEFNTNADLRQQVEEVLQGLEAAK